MVWEDELRTIAEPYREGVVAVKARLEQWPRCVDEVLLPTLQRAARMLAEHGLLGATAERFTAGRWLEAVHLVTGPSPTGAVFDQAIADRLGRKPIVIESSATLGYSLGVDGRVFRWQQEHAFNSLGDPNPPVSQKEIIEEASSLTAQTVERHVLEFLREVIGTSYRRPASKGRVIGFSSNDRWPALFRFFSLTGLSYDAVRFPRVKGDKSTEPCRFVRKCSKAPRLRRDVAGDSRRQTHDLDKVARDHRSLARDSRRFTREFRVMSSDPRKIAS